MNTELEKFLDNYISELKDETGVIPVSSLFFELDYPEYDQIDEIASELAEQIDCLTYGNNCVINVKGRPEIKFDYKEELGMTSEEFDNVLQDYIQMFADTLDKDFSGFVIEGRMGGYWGLSDVDTHVILSPLGIENLKEEIERLAHNEMTKDYDENLTQEDYQSIVDMYNDDIADFLMQDLGNFQFDSDYVSSLTALKARIDAEEEKMNTPEYYSEVITEKSESENVI